MSGSKLWRTGKRLRAGEFEVSNSILNCFLPRGAGRFASLYLLVPVLCSSGVAAAPDVQFTRLLNTLGDVRSSEPSPCGETLRKDWVGEVVRDWYLWNDELADVNPQDFATAQQYLSALTEPLAADGRDPGFSYLTTRQEDESQFTSGAYIGFGFRSGVGPDGELFLADVFEGGPAWDAGFRRGMEVLEVDTGLGFETWDALTQREATNLEVFGPSERGVRRGFRLLDGGDAILEVYVEKDELDPPAIAGEPTLIDRPGQDPVGYLNFRQFTLSARLPLISASRNFLNEGITDYVIDLRYNGGGLLSIADLMLDLLGGRLADRQRSFYVSHNNWRSDYNAYEYFERFSESLDPLRFAFITTRGTASASELVINSLAPHVEVALVGTDTRGKAVGQYPFDQPGCDARVRLVSFEILNGEGEGEYYNGLADTGRFTLCPAKDDLSKAFTDPEEDSLKTALAWLEEGACPTTAASEEAPRAWHRLQALPPWLLYTPDVPEKLHLRRH